VPGDIVNLSSSQLTLVPSDMFLLSGDATVNESMLTGESVPVSKILIDDQDLVQWRETKDVPGESAKSFLYAGTRVVRIRMALGVDGFPAGVGGGCLTRYTDCALLTLWKACIAQSCRIPNRQSHALRPP
jgi:cation-transporting ATPase 13A3/4/5